MIRDIEETSQKPEFGTETELITEELHQIAAVEIAVPNIMLEAAAFRGSMTTSASRTRAPSTITSSRRSLRRRRPSPTPGRMRWSRC